MFAFMYTKAAILRAKCYSIHSQHFAKTEMNLESFQCDRGLTEAGIGECESISPAPAFIVTMHLRAISASLFARKHIHTHRN